jgi:DNA topoisomerase II
MDASAPLKRRFEDDEGDDSAAAEMRAAAACSKYKKMRPDEHVLLRPGMYIGSTEGDDVSMWALDDARQGISKAALRFVPGLYKIFDEIVSNAIDHALREEGCVKNIKVDIDVVTGSIKVWNDGPGIEVQKHSEYNDVWIPELIFGHLLTSTNYDDEASARTGAGQNGIGAKSCNIFSSRFAVETVDDRAKLKYCQVFEDNMTKIHPPTITKCSKKAYTVIEFRPDYARFGLPDGLSEDMARVMRKRVCDVCAVTPAAVNVFLDGAKLEYKSFERYADLYLGGKDQPRAFEKLNDHFSVVASHSDTGFEHISFANGTWTIKGGKHVDVVLGQICKKVVEKLGKKHKNSGLKPAVVRDNLVLFVKCSVSNPTFDSQTKEYLTTPASKMSIAANAVSDKFIDKLLKCGLEERVMRAAGKQDDKSLKKTDGKKRSVLKGLPQLEDANWAGGARSRECTLILTEGLSAATMAIGGLTEASRNTFGVFPLKGKILNVTDQSTKKIADNEEISNLKKILGLESGREYCDTTDLRYGRIITLADSDYDGYHIKGLVFNVFYSLWPSLVVNNELKFMSSMLTPIVKASRAGQEVAFYTLADFRAWMAGNGDGVGYSIKYYKGLGTSTSAEAKQYFKNINQVFYEWQGDQCRDALSLAFEKSKSDERKTWLAGYSKERVLDYSRARASYHDYVHSELVHFSKYDVERSIPSICDGLKTSQRKILYACFKKNLVARDIKVAQLAGYVSEVSAYHHGEASLQGAITGMAQTFVGSNNLNLLTPNGQFGSRRLGGKDAASARYIYTQLAPVVPRLFVKEDNAILNYLEDDGVPIEPEYYIPVLPMVLVNGACGIGTGFSTNVPCYNPADVADMLLRMSHGEDVSAQRLKPWYRGFKGEVLEVDGKWRSRGIFRRSSATKAEVTELPVGTWTQDFKEHIERLMEESDDIRHYESHCTETDVRFVLHFKTARVLDAYVSRDPGTGFTVLEAKLKLVSNKGLSTTNMYLFNEAGQITKYDREVDIVKAFYDIRIHFYETRKEHVIRALQAEMKVTTNKMRFITAVIDGRIGVHAMTKQELVQAVTDAHFDLGSDGSYDYLLKIPIYAMTSDNVAKLRDEIDRKTCALDETRAKTPTRWFADDLRALIACLPAA